MVRLTAILMRRALADNGIAHSSRALVLELLQLYDTINVDVRRAFEEANGINALPENVQIEDVSETDESEGRREEESVNNNDGSGGDDDLDDSDGDDVAAIDEKLALLRKKHEIMALKASIREMKQKAAAAAAAATVEVERPAVSTHQVNSVSNTNVSTAEAVDMRPPTFPVRLPTGVRTMPAPHAAVALPNNSRRIDYRDI